VTLGGDRETRVGLQRRDLCPLTVSVDPQQHVMLRRRVGRSAVGQVVPDGDGRGIHGTVRHGAGGEDTSSGDGEGRHGPSRS
jgi:hypothetical protein